MSLVADIRRYTHEDDSCPMLRDSQITVEPGHITCLFGLSGSGKTTLIRILLGCARGQFDGKIELHTEDRTYDAQSMCDQGLVGVITQGSDLIPWLRVIDNIALPARLNPHLSRPSNGKIEQLCDRINIPKPLLQRFPHEVSFGQRHRIAFVRAVAYSPRLLLLLRGSVNT